MKQYDIEIEEVLTKIVRVEANDINDAISRVEEQIDLGELVLTADDYAQERYIRNYNSKKLDKRMNLGINYNSKDGILTMFHDKNPEAKYVCDSVRDLKNYFNIYLDCYIEESEIEAQIEEPSQELEQEIERE